MDPLRILVPTDVPFWHRRDGAAQRIFELVRYLRDCGGELRVFYLGSLDASDYQAIEFNGLDVWLASDEEPPQSWLPKVRWYLDATLNRMRARADRNDDSQAQTLTLQDFRWSWAMQKFGECYRQFHPSVIVVEYVKLTYLLETLSPAERSSVTCLVDTHDVLHLRCEQFESRGFQHWIRISKEQEAACIQQFDFAIAIQSTEADIFRKLAPHTKTIVARHSVGRLAELALIEPSRLTETEPKIGYLGSRNFSNISALSRFLQIGWPMIVEELPKAKLIVGGNICQWLAEEPAFRSTIGMRQIGMVDDLKDFYSQIDFVINPVEFGTGLKIKNCEPLAFGKPVVTTREGWEGMDMVENDAVLVCDSPIEFGASVLEMAQNATAFRKRCLQAVRLARSELSDEKAYSELRSVIFGI